MDKMKFELIGKELEKVKEFKKHKCKIKYKWRWFWRYPVPVKRMYTYEFTPTGIGMICNVRCNCGKKTDLTCVEYW